MDVEAAKKWIQANGRELGLAGVEVAKMQTEFDELRMGYNKERIYRLEQEQAGLRCDMTMLGKIEANERRLDEVKKRLSRLEQGQVQTQDVLMLIEERVARLEGREEGDDRAELSKSLLKKPFMSREASERERDRDHYRTPPVYGIPEQYLGRSQHQALQVDEIPEPDKWRSRKRKKKRGQFDEAVPLLGELSGGTWKRSFTPIRYERREDD